MAWAKKVIFKTISTNFYALGTCETPNTNAPDIITQGGGGALWRRGNVDQKSLYRPLEKKRVAFESWLHPLDIPPCVTCQQDNYHRLASPSAAAAAAAVQGLRMKFFDMCYELCSAAQDCHPSIFFAFYNKTKRMSLLIPGLKKKIFPLNFFEMIHL